MKLAIPVIALALAAATTVAATQKAPKAGAPPLKPFSVVEATIPEMRLALEEKRTTSREIVLQYLTRIAMYEDQLNAVITVNPNALKEAEALDRERAAGRVRGPLHGIPIALNAFTSTTDTEPVMSFLRSAE